MWLQNQSNLIVSSCKRIIEEEENEENPEEFSTSPLKLVLNGNQYSKLQLIATHLIYYRDLIDRLTSATSSERATEIWTFTARFYLNKKRPGASKAATRENTNVGGGPTNQQGGDIENAMQSISVLVMIRNLEQINFGFEYCSYGGCGASAYYDLEPNACSLYYGSAHIEQTFAYLASVLYQRSNPLLHGNNVRMTLRV